MRMSFLDFVDKRGKQLKKTSTEDLRKFYEVSDEEKEGDWKYFY